MAREVFIKPQQILLLIQLKFLVIKIGVGESYTYYPFFYHIINTISNCSLVDNTQILEIF